MKKLFLAMICFFAANMLWAQGPGVDRKINGNLAMPANETEMAISYNGWIYTATTKFIASANSGGLYIRCSKDNGKTFLHVDSYHVSNVRYEAADITVAGTDTNNLKVFIAGINHNLSNNTYVVFCDVYNGQTLAFISGSVFNKSYGSRKVYDVAIDNDSHSPGVGATPYSVGLLYSVTASVYDSIIYVASNNGGTSFGTTQTIRSTGAYAGNVSIAYGKSASGSNGRYHFAWEERTNALDQWGHVYTARNNSDVTSGPNAPVVCLDSISSAAINKVRRPRIAVSNTSTNNDSASQTAIVTMERDYGTDRDAICFVNMRSHFTNFWYRMADLDNSSNNAKYPDLSFDRDSLRFFGTYHDSSAANLKAQRIGWNIAASPTWTNVATNYADSTTGLVNPATRVVYSPGKKAPAFAWIRTEPTGGIAYFDAMFNPPNIYNTISASICPGATYNFGGNTLSTAGTYSQTFLGINNADSIVTLNLTLYAAPVATVTNTNGVLSTGSFSSYQWATCNPLTPIPGATNATYTITGNGDYAVIVTDANGCKDTSACLAVTGIKEHLAAYQISIAPNPTKSDFQINIGKNFTNGAVRIYDVTGKLMKEITLTSKLTTISLNGMSRGVYTVEVMLDNARGVQKVVLE